MNYRTNLRKGLLVLLAAASAAACRVTSHDAVPGTLGRVASSSQMEAQLAEPGLVTVERVVAGDWEVPLEGLLNLDDPAAQAAGIEDRPEPIKIYFYVIRHSTMGTYLVDSGIGRAFRDGDDTIASAIVESAMNLEALAVHEDTASWIGREAAPIRGVFLTHLHLDHVLGLPDVPRGTPIYVGPGEAESSRFLNLFVQGTTDRALEGHDMRSWRTEADPDGVYEGVVDVFGDGSFFAVHVAGHTAGSMAFVAATADGPVLIAGDTCHTSWGWQHGVEPGEFTEDRPKNRKNLEALRELAARHDGMTVYLGHQDLGAAPGGT